MSPDSDRQQPGVTTEPAAPPQAAPPPPPQDPAELGALEAVLGRIEHAMIEIREQLEAVEHEHRHREFSLARPAGALLQALVVGFVLMALADWLYGATYGQQLVKLAFAGVFQLAALSAFLLAGPRR